MWPAGVWMRLHQRGRCPRAPPAHTPTLLCRDLLAARAFFGGATRILAEKPSLGRTASRLDALSWRAPISVFFDF